MRVVSDWVEGFMSATAHLPSPPIFRRWAAISAVAGVMERKLWVRSLNMDLYPNMYSILVGPPGVGKSVVMRIVENMWRSITGLHVAPKSLTKPSLMDALAEAKRSKTVIDGTNSKFLEFNSLLVNAGELGVLIPQYDSDFMNILTDIYDGGVYEERRRGNNLHILIKKPQLNILGGTTPSYLNQTLPEGAWDQGFLSRTFLIFCGDTSLVDLFGDDISEENHYAELRSDLRSISDMTGAFGFDLESRAAIREWHMSGGQPRPDHPKLVHYNTRRSAHLLKLCMVASVSRSEDKIITISDYRTALAWLLEAESAMGEIFKALSSGGDSKVIEEAYHYIYKIFMATGQPIPEHRLVGFLAEKVPAYNILKIVETMERSGQIAKRINDMGLTGWTPLGRFAA